MLGIGEVWYFSSKTVVFSPNDGFPMLRDEQHCVCAPHKTLKSLFVCWFVCSSQSETSFFILRFLKF
jgi:hypothetical protein